MLNIKHITSQIQTVLSNLYKYNAQKSINPTDLKKLYQLYHLCSRGN